MIVTTQYLNDQIIATLYQNIGSGGFTGPLYGCTLYLFNNNIVLNNGITLAALSEAVFSGYARKANVVFSAPILQGDGSYSMVSNLYTWIATAGSPFTPDVVQGWALITAGSNPQLLMAEVFAAPQPINLPNAGFGLTIQFNYGPNNPRSYGTLVA